MMTEVNEEWDEETWTATTQLRFVKVRIGIVPGTDGKVAMTDRALEQLWQSDKGRQEWRKVPDAA